MSNRRQHRVSLMALALTLSYVLGCRSASVVQPADLGNFVFRVGAADTHMVLPDVEVTLHASCGHDRVLGVTDEYGELSVRKDVLSQAQTGVVVLCERAYFCAGWPVEKLEVASYSEVYVELAPFAIR